MKKRTVILIIIGYILSIIATSTITVIIMKNEEKELNRIKIEEKQENNTTKEEKDVIKPTTEEENPEGTPDKVEEEKNNNIIIIKDESNNDKTTKEDTSTETTLPSNPETITEKSEADVISYVENVSVEGASNKLKSGFVTVVDFLFYGGEIYGKTFQELSNSAKIKVIALALKIDSKIDEYFPDYKEKISTTTKKAYTSIKTKLVTLYLDTTVKICNNNPTLCEDAKHGLNELKQSFGITWDFIKDISGIGITKLKDWYEAWREE